MGKLNLSVLQLCFPVVNMTCEAVHVQIPTTKLVFTITLTACEGNINCHEFPRNTQWVAFLNENFKRISCVHDSHIKTAACYVPEWTSVLNISVEWMIQGFTQRQSPAYWCNDVKFKSDSLSGLRNHMYFPFHMPRSPIMRFEFAWNCLFDISFD